MDDIDPYEMLRLMSKELKALREQLEEERRKVRPCVFSTLILDQRADGNTDTSERIVYRCSKARGN